MWIVRLIWRDQFADEHRALIRRFHGRQKHYTDFKQQMEGANDPKIRMLYRPRRRYILRRKSDNTPACFGPRLST